MNDCANKAYKKADAELNATYHQISGRLKDDPDTTKLLVKAQKAWIVFRDAQCGFAASDEQGGTVYPLVVSQCLTGVTMDRTKELKTFLNCHEGDFGCPVPAQ